MIHAEWLLSMYEIRWVAIIIGMFGEIFMKLETNVTNYVHDKWKFYWICIDLR